MICPKCDFINCLCDDEDDDMAVRFKPGVGKPPPNMSYGGFKIFENKLDDERIYRIEDSIYVPPKLLELLRNASKASEMVAELRERGEKNKVSQTDNYFDNLETRIGVPELDEFIKESEMEL